MSDRSSKSEEKAAQSAVSRPRSGPGAWLSGILWFIAVLMVVVLAWVVSQRVGVVFSSNQETDLSKVITEAEEKDTVPVDVPEFQPVSEVSWVTRLTNAHTIIPEENRKAIETYEVQPGDSVFSIAKKYDIKPETVLWANSDLLQDNPNELTVGQQLKIPAVDGVIYKWKSSDTLEGVANKFKAKVDDILTWPDNHLDLAEPKIASGTEVMIPGGSRELRTWVVPTYWRANSGATRGIQSQCDAGGTALGTGTFIFPTMNHTVSGNDFWSGHLGIDLAAAMGSPVYATDTGVVVYSGPISGGYGLMVMIDHGNGFHSLYAHLSQIMVRCGQNVSQGQTIAYSGSTGNSTGPHLHFEIRFMGAFVNPHDYLR